MPTRRKTFTQSINQSNPSRKMKTLDEVNNTVVKVWEFEARDFAVTGKSSLNSEIEQPRHEQM